MSRRKALPGISRARIALVVISSYDSKCFEAAMKELPEWLSGMIGGIFVPSIVSPVGLDGRGSSDPPMSSIEALAVAASTPVTTVELQVGDALYGSIQKLAFRWALEENFDIVAIVNGSGNFPMGSLAALVKPIIVGECDVVSASRVGDGIVSKDVDAPWYKRFGNRGLSDLTNRLTGKSFDDWHCAYRAYSCRALDAIPFDRNSDGHIFDFEMMVQLLEGNFAVSEIPVSIVADNAFNWIECASFAFAAIISIVRYRSHKMGFGTGSTAFNSLAYELKFRENTSHANLLQWIGECPPGSVLDVGCSDGRFGELVESMGHTVVGVDGMELPGVRTRISEFYETDLDQGLAELLGGRRFDLIVAADVLEHLRTPEMLLAELKALLSEDGIILVSVPNLSHWYGRLKVGSGMFSYDRRGLFDVGHLRFFTPVSFRRTASSVGLEIVKTASTNTPVVDVLTRGRRAAGDSGHASEIGVFPVAFEKLAKSLLRVWPSMFSYQLLFELRETKRGNFNRFDFIKVVPGDGPQVQS